MSALSSSLDAQDLANEQRALLDLIDKLQFAQLDNVKLPQIVVVGDQSAGKSSVLEALSGTPFPRDAGACTRFATEIRLRRAPESTLAVSIIPDKSRDFKEQERLRQFGGTVNPNMPFEDLMRLAVDLVAPKNIPGRFAARDILVVEKRGPDMPLLTLVDLPGLVRNANNDQSIEDIRAIETLSERYMKSSRTIILAVVGGNSDYVQAPILEKARQFDPSGSRTIGVLTKPDLTETIGLEDKFIELVKNNDKVNHFRLGWYVLLNPGPRDPGQPWPSAEERRAKEDEFFNQGKWSSLPESMTGSAALKQKLSTQLQRHIGKHVKTLRKQIQAALDGCDAELKSLGNGKDTPEEMRVELGELFSASNEIVLPAVYGFYKNPPRKSFFRSTADPSGTPAQNLRARAVEENEIFAQKVRENGRKHNFFARGKVVGKDNRREYERQEVEKLLRQNRGTEFPMDPQPRAVYMLFQSYSEYWPKLAQEHTDNLRVVCNEFLSEVLDYAWPKRMREPLRRHFLDPQMKALMQKAQDELEHLIEDKNLEIQPYDPEYEERLKKWREDATQEGGTYTEAQEVLEKMLIHYDLTAKTFIRNVITQVVERHLLQGMYSLFNSAAVFSMTNEIVEGIAAENKQTRDRRLTLKAQRQAIEEAKDMAASLAMRKELRMYAAEDERDNIDETSDEEGAENGSHRRASKTQASQRRRPQRQSNEGAPQVTPTTPQPATNNAYTNGYPTPATPVSSANEATMNRNSGGQQAAYLAPTVQAPQPPPRPDKVRPEDRQPTPQSQNYTTDPYNAPGAWADSNPYRQANGAQPADLHNPNIPIDDYIQHGRRSRGAVRNILGRA